MGECAGQMALWVTARFGAAVVVVSLWALARSGRAGSCAEDLQHRYRAAGYRRTAVWAV
ncbi:MAG TPA: hypothetical protein VIV12_03455 [Streptosporangiaceae bacterium]